MYNQAHPLKVTRVMHGLSQELLAKMSGISQVSISHIENGLVQPRQDTRDKIEKVFDKPIDWQQTFDAGRIHSNGHHTTKKENR